jgi:hypothetical protein
LLRRAVNAMNSVALSSPRLCGSALLIARDVSWIHTGRRTARKISGQPEHVLVTLCPGPTDTPLFDAFKAASLCGAKIGEARAVPMRRIGRPEDYPGIIAFPLSDDAGYMTGQTVSMSGGLTMVWTIYAEIVILSRIGDVSILVQLSPVYLQHWLVGVCVCKSKI